MQFWSISSQKMCKLRELWGGGRGNSGNARKQNFFQGGRPLEDGTKLKEEDGTSTPANQTHVLTSLACPTR